MIPATIMRGDARSLALVDASVDLIITSPPYFALRSYRDGGQHYAGQIGDETTPEAFVEALLEVTRECMRVLKPSGSMWVNLGDKYAGSNGQSGGPSQLRGATYSPDGTRGKEAKKGGFTPRSSVPTKSLMGIPWRYALRCIDDLGLILRAEVIWAKPNGLPESVTDRVARKHEQWFHFTKSPRYYAAVDEIREPSNPRNLAYFQTQGANNTPDTLARQAETPRNHNNSGRGIACNPLGKLPGSVWTVPTEPLQVNPALGVDHFAAFPTEFPRRIILGWAPTQGVCTICGQGLRPIVEKEGESTYQMLGRLNGSTAENRRYEGDWNARLPSGGTPSFKSRPTTITGYECDCTEPGTVKPAVVLDPFGGTGTTAAVARALGCHGISNDMSADYCRLADWRCNGAGFDRVWAKVYETEVVQRDATQLSLFGDEQ